MTKRQRRQSQNSRYMREILDRLREYDVEEVRLLCEKWRAGGGRARRTSR